MSTYCGLVVDEPVIEAVGLGKSYGSTVAVRDLSFQVRRGEVLGLLGPNGAGKTTTLDMLTTLQPLDDGRATVAGFDVATQPRQVRRVIGLAGQSAAVDEMLTARENLRLFGWLYRLDRSTLARRVDEVVERFGLVEFADRPASTYSGGERRRLDVAAALIADPPVVFLDEPTVGLDPRSRSALWQTITDLAEQGTTIVLTTQYLEEADRLADRIVLIGQGRMLADGTPRELKASLERDVLEVVVATETDLATALDILAGSAVVPMPDQLMLHLPIGDGSPAPLVALRGLQDAGVAVTEFQLRRPTLDDVFLTLTEEQPA
jgi:ABC-2 type transport system ATP-binding protein